MYIYVEKDIMTYILHPFLCNKKVSIRQHILYPFVLVGRQHTSACSKSTSAFVSIFYIALHI